MPDQIFINSVFCVTECIAREEEKFLIRLICRPIDSKRNGLISIHMHNWPETNYVLSNLPFILRVLQGQQQTINADMSMTRCVNGQ